MGPSTVPRHTCRDDADVVLASLHFSSSSSLSWLNAARACGFTPGLGLSLNMSLAMSSAEADSSAWFHYYVFGNVQNKSTNRTTTPVTVSRKATPHTNNSHFCIRLNEDKIKTNLTYPSAMQLSCTRLSSRLHNDCCRHKKYRLLTLRPPLLPRLVCRDSSSKGTPEPDSFALVGESLQASMFFTHGRFGRTAC